MYFEDICLLIETKKKVVCYPVIPSYCNLIL